MKLIDKLAHPLFLAQLSTCLFLAILFIQSGLDKIVDWKGNLGWLQDHFSKSPFQGIVPQLLGVITLLEISSGVISGLGAGALMVSGRSCFAVLGLSLSALSLLSLFFGQRMAKDYAGAATLVPYFLVCLFGFYLFSV